MIGWKVGGWTHGCNDAWNDGWKEGRMNEWTDGLKDGRMDGQMTIYILTLYTIARLYVW